VYLPAMMGWIVVSLRISVAFALLSAVVAEFLGSNQGIGHLISAGQAVLDPSSVLAGVVVIALLTVIIDSALQVAEARLTPWRP
jgi:NitT/TauT family transport system permease protein